MSVCSSKPIHLSEEDFIGRGIAKRVYRHPGDDGICVKFPNGKKRRAIHDIRREIKYLKKHQENLPWLSRYLGEVESNLGTGFMYELVRHEDGALASAITAAEIDHHSEALLGKVKEMYFQLIAERAVVNDLRLANVFFRRKLDGGFDLILIDGFGNNNLIKIADYSSYFRVQKLNRKFKKLCGKLGVVDDFLVGR